MEDKTKNKKDQQDFIVETPIYIEEKMGKNTDKVKKYERGKFLGKGGFAKCYEMKCIDTKKIYAAKVFEKKALSNARSRKKLINEIKLHKKLHHQNIVNFEHFFEDKDNVYILLELCSNQTLNELLKRRKRLTEIEVQCYLIQIIKALKYIHTHKIIHRDLKLGNCFITGKLELKLGDFGLAAKLEYEGQRRRTVCGTPNYIAPEILEKKNGHSFEVDVWSLGVVAYTLLFGRPPYETSDVKLTYKKIKMNNYSFPENIKVHPSAKKLIASILNLDPSKRPSLDAILEHEFFRIYNSVPIVLPLSTLACPPSMRYISQFLKNGENNFQMYNHNKNNSANMNFNNTFTNFNHKFNSNTGGGNGNILQDLNINDLNTNMNSAENINFNNNVSSEIINRLLHASENPFNNHRKSESMTNILGGGNNLNNLNDENFMEKVNLILQNVNTHNNTGNNNGSRNINKNEINLINSEGNSNKNNNLNNLNNNLTKDELNSIINDGNGNIINNNFFINVANLNNMELKLDESVLKKLEENPLSNSINRNLLLQNLNNLNQNQNSNKKFIFNKISKFYDYVNKFGIIYFVNTTHIGICFNDNSNLLKNIYLSENENNLNNGNLNNILNNKNFQYLYVDKDGKNTLNYDEVSFDNYIKNTKTGSKDLIKKFDIFKHILNKYTSEILALAENEVNSISTSKMFYVKKFLKVNHAVMFRLSNKLIQVCFVDKTELIMSTESSDFYYKTKNGEEFQDSITNVMNGDNVELIKRIKYAKNLLIHFVKNQKSKKVPK